MWKRAAFVLFCALAALPARADFAAGKAAYEAKDYATAMTEWRPLAEAGDADAEFEIGRLYRFGRGLRQDYKTAIEWFVKAARQGQVNALTTLGYMYDVGEGLPKLKGRAECLYLIAAQSGYANAQWGYYRIRAETRVLSGAQDWLERAARQGQTSALYVRGKIMLLNSLYTDKTEAYLHLLAAAKQGNENAIRLLKTERTQAGAKARTEIAEAERQAVEWRPVVEPKRTIPLDVYEMCLP